MPRNTFILEILITVSIAILMPGAYAKERYRPVHRPHVRKWYDYQPHVVSLTGILRKYTSYEPPGYSETPSIGRHDTTYVLESRVPISIKGTKDFDTERGISNIAVTGAPGLYSTFAEAVGRIVELNGVLHQPLFRFHPTEVMFLMKKMVIQYS